MDNKENKDIDKDVSFFKANPERYWFIADRWFRILEFSILLSVLNYFREKTGNIFITILLILSFAIFMGWFIEFQEYLFDRISKFTILSKKKKILIDALMFLVFIGINLMVFKATSIIALK